VFHVVRMTRERHRLWIDFGRDVRDVRLARRMSIRDLATRAGVSASTLYRIEAGELASTDAADQIASALGRRAELHLIDPRRRDQRPNLSADPVHSLMGEFEARHFRSIVDGMGIDEPYQHFQFSGRADFVAWRLSPTTALLHIENRTRFPDFQEMAGAFNAKRAYLGPAIAERLGVRKWQTQTHVIAALWSAEVLHALRLRAESFQALCPGDAQVFGDWWAGGPPSKSGVALVVLDPLATARERAWVGLDDAKRVRPRHAGYAEAARKIAA
jgi:transcriptional regulator with XRE-family HTH domain